MLYSIMNKKIIFSFFSLILFQILLTLVQNSITQMNLSEKNSFISINEAVILVNDKINDIKKLEGTTIIKIGTHDNSIQENKELINLNDDTFIIFGKNKDSVLYYQKINFINSLINSDSVIDTQINFTTTTQHHIHCNSLNNCIIALTNNGEFLVYQINLDNNLINLIHQFGNNGRFIQCDSFSSSKIFCIYGINGNQIMYDYFDSSTSTVGNLCQGNNCIAGSVAKLDVDSEQKFLVCFQQGFNVICQYFDYKGDQISLNKTYNDIYNYNQFCSNENYILILTISNYSIFLKTTCFFGETAALSHTKLISLDFKIMLDLDEDGKNWERAISLFNDKKNYYEFSLSSGSTQVYYLKIHELLQTNPIEVIYYSKTNNELYDLSSTHNDETLNIAMDPSTELYQNDVKIEVNSQSNKILINSNDNFIFGRPSRNKLTNYYCYNKATNGENAVSLVGKIELKICYNSCNKCNINEIGTISNHYCTMCNNDYYPFLGITNSNGDNFNCYFKNSSEVSRAFFLNDAFYYCHDSCNSCENQFNCLTCRDGYYFKVDFNNELLYNDYCLNSLPYKHFFDYNANILNKNNEAIQSVYKPCYETCSSCKTSGTIDQNNCDECIDNLTKYKFNEGQCLINTSLCTEDDQFWKLENNNISCMEDCNSSIISEGVNKGQCVEDCKNYLNPYISSRDKDINFLTLTCTNKTYCIPYESCNEIGFIPSKDGLECLGFCDDFNIFEFNNIIDYINSLPVPNETKVVNMTIEEKIININKRKKRIETFQEEKTFDEVINSFGLELISNYNVLFKSQNPNPEDLGYLITSTTYDNFTVTIYPLDIENFVYENLFIIYNLGFVNFTKVYPNFLNYEVKTGNIILICIMEYFSHNYSINDLNYFVYSFDEASNSSFRLLQENVELPIINGLSNESSKYEIEYPLHDYINESVSINKRNSEYLVENIIQMNKDFPEVDISNLSDSFYNDVCFLFTSDVGTDMTLNDRRQEYYINYSLCEDNCTLINVKNKDTNPRAVCICDMKTHLFFNQKPGKEYEIESLSSHPIKSFVCFTETFNIYIGKNPIFWIFMIILVYQIYLLTMYIKYQTKVIKEILGIWENNNQNGSGSISSSVYSKIIINESELKSSKNKESKESEENSNSEKDKSSEKDEKKSAPVNAYNPPRKKGKLKENFTSNNLNKNDKDLISKSDSTFLKENNTNNNNININNKNYEESEISYSDIKNGFEMIEVNNLVEQNTIMENNFLNSPMTIEKVRRMKRIKKAMNPLKEEESKKYFQTLEDILYSNNNKHKFKNKKNKEVAINLGGEDIINKNLIDNYSDDETKPGFPKNKFDMNITSEKYRTIGSDHIIFQKSIDNNNNDTKNNFSKEENSSQKKSRKNKNNNNNENMDNIFESKNNNNSLAKSLGKKDINNLKNEKDKKIKTEDDLDNNNNTKIKNELKKIGKGKIRPNSGKDKSQDIKYKKKSHEKINKNNINNENLKNNRINNESIKLENKYNSKYNISNKKKLIDESDNSNVNLKNKSSESDYNNNLIKSNKIRSMKLKNKKEENKINKIELSNSNNKDVLYINKKKEEEKLSSENKEGSKIVDSKRNMIKFQEETEMEGDKVNKDLALEKLKQKRTQNLDLLNDKAPVSSVVEFLETENKEIQIEDNFILFYWKYFIKRELWFIVIRDKNKSIPYFVRYSCLGFCITFIFLLNCFFFLESAVHKRYIKALEGANMNISYYFKQEFATTIYVTLIGNVFKMIVIKVVLFRVFKLGKNMKKLMRNSAEKGLTKDEVEQLRIKREQFFEWYKKGLIIYFCILMGLTVFFGYICTCYGGVYKNSINYFLFGLLFSLIFSFIFCAAICFLIVGLYKLGKIYNSKCAISAYIVLSTLY